MQTGITLIALVISIIVMMILAGVSISAIVGDDGILAKTQYASFINEMATIEEAVQMWKVNQDDMETAIPTKGICTQDTVDKAERLKGEVGFYRAWNTTRILPSTPITSSANDFNIAFSGEVVYYPGGVQDLYYLDNDALGISKNKKYVIDAVNGIIYSTSGVALNGVRCYSSYMAKAVNSGNIEMPLFASAEVSGGAASGGQALAGNKEPEYILNDDGTVKTDDEGNPVKNPNYNPNAFQIIADATNGNVYKLYNNGDLYGKGVKGPLLNTLPKDIEDINAYEYTKLTIPSEIPGATTGDCEVSIGFNAVYVIDSNKELWAWGSNSSNKFGLSQAQQVEFTGREATKINVAGKKVYKVFPQASETFVVTISDGNYELYASGYNSSGELGIGTKEEQTSQFFPVIGIENPKDITFVDSSHNQTCTHIIMTGDGANKKIYFAGNANYDDKTRKLFKDTEYDGKYVTNFVEICNGEIGEEPPVAMLNYYDIGHSNWYVSLGTDGKAYDWRLYDYKEIVLAKDEETAEDILADNVTEIAVGDPGAMVLKRVVGTEIEFWGRWTTDNDERYLSYIEKAKYVNINEFLPCEASEIKTFGFDGQRCLYFITNSGKVYASGINCYLGIGRKDSSIASGIVNITENSNLKAKIVGLSSVNQNGGFITRGLVDNDGNIYMTCQSNILFRNNVLQTNWYKIASNVKTFNASSAFSSIAYIDKNDDIWVAGNDSIVLGLNDDSSKSIPNFVKLKEYLEGTEVYEDLDSNIKDYCFSGTSFYVLTKSKNLYASGKLLSGTWTKYTYIGVPKANTEDLNIPTKILTNVEKILMGSMEKLALCKNDEGNFELYYWGIADGTAIPSASFEPKKWTSGDTVFADAIDVDLLDISYDTSFIGVRKANNYTFYTCGRVAAGSVNGTGAYKYNYTALEIENTFEEPNYKSILVGGNQGGSSFLVLTENNKLYGFGRKNLLGKGLDSADVEQLPVELSLPTTSKIQCVAGGSGWYVIVTEDGKVYGTGSNQNGVLGRWIGVDRNSPNSRYKTAFEWVECPELEI